LQPLLQVGKLFVKTPEQVPTCLQTPLCAQWKCRLQQPALKLAAALLQGAATSIYLASSPDVEGVSSKYFVDCRPQTSNKESYDTDVARRLWDVSQELTGVTAQIPEAVAA